MILKTEDCSNYPDYSGEHLVCEIRNEQLKAAYWDGIAIGGLAFFILGLALMWLICWCEKKEQDLKSRYPY